MTEAVVGVPMEVDEEEDDEEETREENTTGKGSKAKPKNRQLLRQSYIPPFAPDLSETKTTPKMSKAISEFILTSIGSSIHGMSWTQLTLQNFREASRHSPDLGQANQEHSNVHIP